MKKRRGSAHSQRGVPASRTDGGSVWARAEAGNAVLVAVDHRKSGAFQDVPGVQHVVVVGPEEEAACGGSGRTEMLPMPKCECRETDPEDVSFP